jgi:hypothetical protein
MRCSYVYFIKDDPDRVQAVVPEHAAYSRGLELRDYLGGPFTDRSGGLISFATDSREEAEQLVAHAFSSQRRQLSHPPARSHPQSTTRSRESTADRPAQGAAQGKPRPTAQHFASSRNDSGSTGSSKTATTGRP